MRRDAILLAAGLFSWTIIEYVVHGVLAHSHRTFVTKIHGIHHGDPHRVFTIRAWPWVAIVYFGSLALVGISASTIYLSGIIAGFLAYEFLHYRFHFVKPGSDLEAWLRARHLAHHAGAPNAYFGVTTPLWDLIFGSEPERTRRAELEARASQMAPLTGRTNIERITSRFRFSN